MGFLGSACRLGQAQCMCGSRQEGKGRQNQKGGMMHGIKAGGGGPTV